MTFEYIIEISGKIKSLELYKKLEKYNVNLTDIIFLTFVYGEADLNTLIKIILTCSKYGKVKVNFIRRT